MWPRVVEVMLGAWLLVTPFIFRATPEVDAYTASAFAAGAIAAVASLASCWDPLRHARFLTLGVSFWLMLHGYFSAARPGPPAAQNELVVGSILLLFAILPNEINAKPRPWRETGQGSGAQGFAGGGASGSDA